MKADGTWYYIDMYWNAGRGSFKYFLSEGLWDNHKLTEKGTYYNMWYSGDLIYMDSL